MKERFTSRLSHAFRHPADIHDPLTTVEITGMTFAGTTLSVLQVVIHVFIAYYYTNVVGLSATLVGTLLLVTRVADAFSDLGVGILISKTNSRSGKARPWAIRMALPLLLSVVVTFCVPQHWGMTAKAIYACVTYFLMITIAVTPAGVVASVLGTMMTVNAQSRQKNAFISTIFVMLGCVIGTFATQTITESMGDTYQVWRAVAIGFGLLSFVGQVILYLFTKERGCDDIEGKAGNPLTLKQSMPALVKNKYFIIMCFVGLFTSIDTAMASCAIYFYKYILCNTTLIGIMSSITLLSTLAGTGAVPILTKKVSPKALVLGGLAIKIISFAINMALPTNLPLFIAFTAIRGFAGAAQMVYGGVYLLNTIEYGEYKTGIRANSLVVTVSSVGTKIGSGIGGALIGWLLAFSGYIGGAAEQPAPVQAMIVCIYFFIPLLATAAQLALLCFYNLDKKYDRIVQTLRERKGHIASNAFDHNGYL